MDFDFLLSLFWPLKVASKAPLEVEACVASNALWEAPALDQMKVIEQYSRYF
jgi:hypothetical protein